MSLVVPCPGCPTKLSAPESAAGKQIRCPKCKAVVTVPAFVPAEEVPVVDAKVTAPAPAPKLAPRSKPALDTTTTFATCLGCASTVCVIGTITDGLIHCPKCGFATPAPKKSGAADDDEEDEEERPRKKRARRDEEDDDDRPRKTKKRRVYDDEDDEDDEDDRPRKRKRKPVKSGGGGGGRVIFLVLGLLVLFGLCGGGLYYMTGKGGVFAKKTPVPPGWKEYSYPQDGFKAYFPSAPELVMSTNNPMRFGAPPAGGGFGGAPELAEVESASVYSCGDGLFGGQPGGTSVTVTVQKFRNGVPRSLRDNVGQVTNAKFGNMQSRRIRWLGYDAGEVVTGNLVMRIVCTDNAQITVQIVGPKGARVTPEEENGFFDNFQLLK